MHHSDSTKPRAARAPQTALLALCAVLAHPSVALAQQSPSATPEPSKAQTKATPEQDEFAKPCPMGAVKHAFAMRSIKAKRIKCVLGRFPDPGWAISYWTDTDTDEPKLNLRVLANKGWKFVAHRTRKGPPSFPATTSVIKLQSVDLNGDGVAELLRFTRFSKGNASERHLEVLRIEGKRLKQEHHILVGYIEISDDVPGDIQCIGNVHISSPSSSGKRYLTIKEPSATHKNSETFKCTINGKTISIQ